MTQDEFKKIRESFFNTIFVLLGRIANCDGYVNRDEIKRTQNYMDKMQLSAYCRKKAIRLFRTGSSPTFDMNATLEEFREAVTKSPRIIEVLLVYMISVARVDGMLVEKEIKMIRQVASILGYSSIIFDHMLRMITAQENIYNSTNGDGSANKNQSSHSKENTEKDNTEPNNQPKLNPGQLLEAAYNALGIDVGSDKTEVKKAYRKLVNQYHPDKVQGQGLPPEFINAATEYFKRIQTAFEYISNH
ncbi:MAG: co-chaperone DjlA [Gammaproteobacteria bacterium]|nr:MAG: co-chaperone DjlA [Gammaproteobacteria bacterium]